ncbi:MAG: hypothetical protein QM730_26525 [Anaerolineales bacterium]
MRQLFKFTPFFFFPVMVLFAHGIASGIFHLYTVFPHADIPFHYLGGFSIAFTSVQIVVHLEKEQYISPLNKSVCMILVFSLTATATVLWEFAEFTLDQVVGTNVQISLANTMQDQFMGILGGLTWILIYYRVFFGQRKDTTT